MKCVFDGEREVAINLSMVSNRIKLIAYTNYVLLNVERQKTVNEFLSLFSISVIKSLSHCLMLFSNFLTYLCPQHMCV